MTEIFWNKSSLKGCKWASLNAPCTETPVSPPFLGESLFLIFTLWGNKHWAPQYKDVQPADIGLPTGNGKKLSCTQAQLGQATGLAVA